MSKYDYATIDIQSKEYLAFRRAVLTDILLALECYVVRNASRIGEGTLEIETANAIKSLFAETQGDVALATPQLIACLFADRELLNHSPFNHDDTAMRRAGLEFSAKAWAQMIPHIQRREAASALSSTGDFLSLQWMVMENIYRATSGDISKLSSEMFAEAIASYDAHRKELQSVYLEALNNHPER